MLSANQVFESVFSEAPLEHPVRILWMSRESDLATLFTLREPYKVPWQMRLHEMESMLQTARLRAVAMRLPAFMLQSEDELSNAAKSKRRTSWDLISPMLERYGNRIYSPRELGGLIAAYAKEVDKPLKSIYRLLFRY
jgi:hypothetical protein